MEACGRIRICISFGSANFFFDHSRPHNSFWYPGYSFYKPWLQNSFIRGADSLLKPILIHPYRSLFHSGTCAERQPSSLPFFKFRWRPRSVRDRSVAKHKRVRWADQRRYKRAQLSKQKFMSLTKKERDWWGDKGASKQVAVDACVFYDVVTWLSSIATCVCIVRE